MQLLFQSPSKTNVARKKKVVQMVQCIDIITSFLSDNKRKLEETKRMGIVPFHKIWIRFVLVFAKTRET